MLAVGADAREGIERFRTLGFVEALLHQLCVTQDGGERGPQLVAHVGDELRFVLAGDLEVLDGLSKLLGSRLHLLEESCVLNGDYCLIGKRFDQFNLSVRKGRRISFPNEDDSDDATL